MDIIDSFVVTLGLDPTNYKKESDQFRSDFKRLKEDGHSTALSLESDGKRAANYFASLKNEVIGVVLAIAGARSMGGLISDMVSGAAATGRLASNLGMATEELSAWQQAIRTVNGEASDADHAIRQMVDAYQTYRLTGTTGHDADFQGLGISLNELRSPTQALMEMAAAGERLGRPEFTARLQRIGIPDSVITMLSRGRRGMQELITEQERLGVVTDHDARVAQEFQRDWANLTTQLRSDLRPILTWLIEQGLPFLHDHMGEVGGAAAGLAVGIAALTFEIWAIPAAVAAAGAALVWLGDRFHALDAWRDFALHVQSLRIEGQLLGIPDDSNDESIPRATRREHAAQRMALLQQLQAINDERWEINQRVHGVSTAPPMPTGAGGAAGAPGAGTSGAFSAIAARIRQTEGGRSGYDAVVYNIRGIIDHPTGRTIGDIYDRQPALTRATRGRRGSNDPGSSAIGAYQMVRGTLATAAEGVFGANWRSQIFNPATQDRLAQWLYERHGLSPWAIGGGARLPNGGARMAARGGHGGGPVHIGSIVVYTPHGTTGAQAEAVARAIPRAVARRNVATQANTGLR